MQSCFYIMLYPKIININTIYNIKKRMKSPQWNHHKT